MNNKQIYLYKRGENEKTVKRTLVLSDMFRQLDIKIPSDTFSGITDEGIKGKVFIKNKNKRTSYIKCLDLYINNHTWTGTGQTIPRIKNVYFKRAILNKSVIHGDTIPVDFFIPIESFKLEYEELHSVSTSIVDDYVGTHCVLHAGIALASGKVIVMSEGIVLS